MYAPPAASARGIGQVVEVEQLQSQDRTKLATALTYVIQRTN